MLTSAYLLVGSQKGILSSYLLPTDLALTPDSNPEPTHILVEHSDNICCLDVSKGSLVASGSWDKCATA
jgi:phospholipase A-2-activating protein